MPRVRFLIRNHDGSSQRVRFWNLLSEVGIFIIKLIETKDAMVAIADATNVERMFTDDIKVKIRQHGFDPLTPPEMTANRTVIVRDVDTYITGQDEAVIVKGIVDNQMLMGSLKVIKIPTNPRMLKIVFDHNADARYAIASGLIIMQQSISPDSIEMEKFINLRQCMKCYSFEHVTRKCNIEGEHLICSECAERGHRYNNCNNVTKKCVNCQGPHRTLAYRCPTRKKKLKEVEQKRKNKEQADRDKVVIGKVAAKLDDMLSKLPDNFVTTITTAIIFAKMKESEEYGSFQRTFDSIMQANKVPKVIIPRELFERVLPDMQSAGAETDRGEGDRRKRGRSGDDSEGEEEEMEGAVGFAEPIETPVITPSVSLVSLDQVPITFTKPPERKKEKTEQKEKGKEKDDVIEELDPRILIIAPNNLNFTKIATETLYKELALGKRIKYLYRERSLKPEIVRQIITDRTKLFTARDIHYVEVNKFQALPHGKYVKLDPRKKEK